MSVFDDPSLVERYVEDTCSRVPGLQALHKMSANLLAEFCSDKAQILVVGAGGGLEIRAMGLANGKWQFTGVDPSHAMVELAQKTTASLSDRVTLIKGYVDDAPFIKFDGALCLLTLHFLTREERLDLLRSVYQRLKPGARLVLAHHCAEEHSLDVMLARSVAFANSGNSAVEENLRAARSMVERLNLLVPDEEVALLYGAGFASVNAFYQAFSFRGWVAIA